MPRLVLSDGIEVTVEAQPDGSVELVLHEVNIDQFRAVLTRGEADWIRDALAALTEE